MDNRVVDALKTKDLELLKALYGLGVDFNARYYVGASVIHMAIYHKFPIALQFFDSINLNFNIRDATDRNPLHFAASQGDVVCIRYLLTFHAELNGVNPADLASPVCVATVHNFVEAVKVFLELTKVDPMEISGTGRNLFQTTAARGNLEVLELLVDHFKVNALDVLMKAKYGLNQEKPPYVLAKEKKHTKTVNWIETRVRLQGNLGKLLLFRSRQNRKLGWI